MSFNKLILFQEQTLFFKFIQNPESITEDNVAAFHKALNFVEEQLKSRGTRFLDGAEPGFVDYMIWPWFERLLAFKEKYHQATIDAQKYKLLVSILLSLTVYNCIHRYIFLCIFVYTVNSFTG